MHCRLVRCCRVLCWSVLTDWGLGHEVVVGVQAGLVVEVEMLADMGRM